LSRHVLFHFIGARGRFKICGFVCRRAEKHGTGGLTVVIIREDLIGKAPEKPSPTYARLQNPRRQRFIIQHTRRIIPFISAGLFWNGSKIWAAFSEMKKNQRAQGKASLRTIWTNPPSLPPPSKETFVSIMNIPFVTGNEEKRPPLFIKEASKRGFVNLKGHRTVGGMRASIYNAMPQPASRLGFLHEGIRNSKQIGRFFML
jgi:phosphoserine aminotransferase